MHSLRLKFEDNIELLFVLKLATGGGGCEGWRYAEPHSMYCILSGSEGGSFVNTLIIAGGCILIDLTDWQFSRKLPASRPTPSSIGLTGRRLTNSAKYFFTPAWLV